MNRTLAPDNRDLFRTLEFDFWARCDGLIDEERFLIERYLQAERSTLEAGTAGGRILLQLQRQGFESLRGFDIVEELLQQARRRSDTGRIAFDRADARQLPYADASFGQVIYLQQVLCFIDDEAGRRRAMAEACRVLEPGGVALFSFLGFEVRARPGLYSPFLAWLRLLRRVRGSGRVLQSLPWFRLADRFNRGVLLDRGPYVYWYRTDEAWQQLRDAGFDVVAMGSKHQICVERRLCATLDEFRSSPIDGMYYFVCVRPGPSRLAASRAIS